MITDFHTHAFPDGIAERAIATLSEQAESDGEARLDGTLGALLESMDAAGIERAVLCSIATKPEQFDNILAWSCTIASDRIVPFPSVHPMDPAAKPHIADVAAAGLKGIKLHPYHQDFYLDDDAVFGLYEEIERTGLILVCHTGFDIGFPRVRRADPARVVRVLQHFPELKFVTTHLGGWQDWGEVRKHLLGKPIYVEMSYALGLMPDDQVRDMILSHPPEYVLFGTDSPWQDQGETLEMLRGLGLGKARETAILEENPARLLE